MLLVGRGLRLRGDHGLTFLGASNRQVSLFHDSVPACDGVGYTSDWMRVPSAGSSRRNLTTD